MPRSAWKRLSILRVGRFRRLPLQHTPARAEKKTFNRWCTRMNWTHMLVHACTCGFKLHACGSWLPHHHVTWYISLFPGKPMERGRETCLPLDTAQIGWAIQHRTVQRLENKLPAICEAVDPRWHNPLSLSPFLSLTHARVHYGM